MNARAAIIPAPIEDDECRWLTQWAATVRWHGYKLDSLLILVPNGAYHGTDRRAGAVVARKLREKGLRPGAFDYLLALPDFKRGVAGALARDEAHPRRGGFRRAAGVHGHDAAPRLPMRDRAWLGRGQPENTAVPEGMGNMT